MKHRIAAVVCLIGAAILHQGCASECTKLTREYKQVVEAEQAFVETPPSGDDLPVHFGVAIRESVLDKVVDRAVNAGLQKALAFSEKISLATGQKLGLETKGEVADLGLFPDDACDECLRIDGRLGGQIRVKLPVLGAQSVPLKGSFSLVAPVQFERAESGRAAVKLDLARAAELGKSHVDPEVTQLPPTWWKVIEGPLGELMLEAATKDLEPVTLFEFDGPDLGVDGLEILPARIVSDARRGVVFAGFSSNLAAPIEAGEGLKPRTDLGKNENFAVAVDSRVFRPLAVAMMQSEKLSRRWTRDGAANPEGQVRVSIRDFELGDATDGSRPYAMTFRAWNLPEEGKCWWADARASGQLAMAKDTRLDVSIEDAKIEDSSLPGVFQAIANWKSSRLFKESARVVTRTLDEETVEFPGGKVELRKAKVAVDGTSVWLRGRVAVTD
jgi:hypothetical protein